MSDTPMKAIIGANNEVQYVPLTAEEITQRELDLMLAATAKAEAEAEAEARAALKESAKAKLVAGEPLTEEEAAVIVL